MKRRRTTRSGFTLVEVLTSLVVFGLISAAIYSAYYAQVTQTTEQYGRAKTSMDLQIIKSLIEHDIAMAGFGLVENFDSHPNAKNLADRTRAIGAISGASVAGASVAPDQMTIMGTALGIGSRFSQGWTVVKGTAPVVWIDDPRDSLQDGTRYVAIDPIRMSLASPWVGEYNSTSNLPIGLPQGRLLYALYTNSTTSPTTVNADANDGTLMPHYEVGYDIGGGQDPLCATGALSLRRRETRRFKDDLVTPEPGTVTPLLNCVLNMQVAFGLDQSDPVDDVIDLWDNGGATIANALSRDDLNKQLKQVRVYILSQVGGRDDDYQSPSPIRVGEEDLGTGGDIALDQNQENYKWNLLTIVVTPRNMR